MISRENGSRLLIAARRRRGVYSDPLMRLRSALVLFGAALAARGVRAADADKAVEAPAEPPPTFEALAAPARPLGEVGLGAVLGALVDRCPDDKHESEIERARCRGTSAYLRRTLPERSFSITAGDPAAVTVSSYDPAVKGYRLGLSGCLACSSPIPVGRSGEPLLVTLGKPVEKGAAGDALAGAVEIASVTLPFASEGEAQTWLREVRPRLRAQLVFKPPANEWRLRATRGYAFALIAGRIVDRCAGTVLLSSPPSTGLAERASVASASSSDSCAPVARATAPAGPVSPGPPPGPASAATPDDNGDGEEHLPVELSRGVIAEAMGRIRSQVFACFERFRVPGSAPLTYEVAGNGSIQSVRLAGTLNGTPSGDCVLEAARGARFSRFDGPIQTFTYPFFLRR
jgi:hypothetical protein